MKMTNNEFEDQVKIQQEAIRRENQRKMRDAENLACIIGTQSSNPRIASFCRNYLKGKAIGGIIFVLIMVGFILGCLYQIPWAFTIPVFAFCIWYLARCHDAEITIIAVIVDVMMIAFWALMRFGVMPCSW